MGRRGRKRICQLRGVFSEEHPQKHEVLLFKAWSAAFQVPIWSLAELCAKVQLGKKHGTARESCRALGKGQEGTAGESCHLNREVLPQMQIGKHGRLHIHRLLGGFREALLQMQVPEHPQNCAGAFHSPWSSDTVAAVSLWSL